MAEKNAAILAADTLGHDMVDGILQEVRQIPGWEGLKQHQQEVHIQRIGQRVRHLVSQALDIIFKGEHPACAAELGAVTFGKVIRARIEIAKTAQSRHELADATGQSVVIVMADPEQYLERLKEIRATADQRDMFHDPAQPLGHMGSDQPPPAPLDPAQPGDGLEDKMPEAEPQEPLDVPEELTMERVLEALQDTGLYLGTTHMWTEQEKVDAYVWSIAFHKAREAAQGNADAPPPPPVPESLRWAMVQPASDQPSAEGEKREVESASASDTSPPVWDGSTEHLIELLAAKRVIVTKKVAKGWSSTQRMTAVSWLSGKMRDRPDFLPAPKVPAPGQEPTT